MLKTEFEPYLQQRIRIFKYGIFLENMSFVDANTKQTAENINVNRARTLRSWASSVEDIAHNDERRTPSEACHLAPLAMERNGWWWW